MVRRLSADTAMLVGCALTWGVALAIVIPIDAAAGVRAFAWMPWGVLPLGAFATGLVAGSGGLLGLALSRMRPTAFGLALPAVVGASIPLSFHWLLWYFGPVGAGPAPSDTIPLVAWLEAAFGDPAYAPSAAATALQFIGAFAGGALVSAVVLWVDACPRCSELMSDAGRIERFVDDASRISRMSALPLDDMGYVSMLAALDKVPTGLIRIEACLKLCKHCGMGEIVEVRRQRSGSGWGRPATRRKYGARAPALVRWFVPTSNAAAQAAPPAAEAAARAGGRG